MRHWQPRVRGTGYGTGGPEKAEAMGSAVDERSTRIVSYDSVVSGFLWVKGQRSDVTEDTRTGTFTEFVGEHEWRIRSALTSALGIEIGREAAAEAMAYAWEHWGRVSQMLNPAAYLFVVGRNRGRRMLGRRVVHLPEVYNEDSPWVEPGLPAALVSLSEAQRTVVMLLHGYDWTMDEVAEVLGVSKSTVQTHAERGMKKLRRKLKAEVSR